jgi:hypothetical protein
MLEVRVEKVADDQRVVGLRYGGFTTEDTETDERDADDAD